MNALVYLTAAFALGAPGLKPEKKSNDIVGEWIAESMMSAGKDRAMTGEPLKYQFTKDGKWIVYRGERKIGTDDRNFNVDAKANPLRVDLTYGGGEQEPRKTLGIFKVEGDKLTLCIGGVNSDRPTTFEPTAESPATVYIFKRVK